MEKVIHIFARFFPKLISIFPPAAEIGKARRWNRLHLLGMTFGVTGRASSFYRQRGAKRGIAYPIEGNQHPQQVSR